MLAMGTGVVVSTPPIVNSSPYGSTITSPAPAQWRSPPGSATQHRPDAMTWNSTSRSAPGCIIPAKPGPPAPSKFQLSENSHRMKRAPSRRSRSRARSSASTGAAPSVTDAHPLPLRSSIRVSRSFLSVPVHLQTGALSQRTEGANDENRLDARCGLHELRR